MLRLRWLYLVLSIVLGVSACGQTANSPTPIRTVAPSTISATPSAQAFISVRLSDPQGKIRTSAPVGSTLRVFGSFNPTTIGRDSAGKESLRYLYGSAVAKMQVCTSFDTPCALDGQWIPFTTSPEFNLPVDWVGPRKFWIAAKFQGPDGTPIPGIIEDGKEADSTYMTISGVLDEKTPVAQLPEKIQAAVAAARAVYPVTGSIAVAGGRRCCMAGTGGEILNIPVSFKAASPLAPVTEMRISERCRREEDMAAFPWEPLTATKSLPYRLPGNNWYTFEVGVQYRDAKGNLSEVYCDELAVEGMPIPSRSP